jgi:hypothetical protein
MKFRETPRMSRRDAAEALSCSVDNVRKMDRTRRLITGKKGPDGAYTYERQEIEAVAKQKRQTVNGVVSAEVFKMFANGDPHHVVCIRTCLPPATIRALRHEFDRGYADETPAEKLEREKLEAQKERERRESAETVSEQRMKALQVDIDSMIRRVDPTERTSVKNPRVESDPTAEIAKRSIERANEYVRQARESRTGNPQTAPTNEDEDVRRPA